VRSQQLLAEAAEAGHIKVVRYLHGAGVNIASLEANDLENAACTESLKVFRYLVNNGADRREFLTQSSNQAAAFGRLEILKHLDEVQPRFMKKQQQFLCHVAAEHGQLEVLRYLEDCGAELSSELIMPAIRDGHLNVVRYLYERLGADCCRSSESVKEAVTKGNLEVLQYLYEQGADLSVCGGQELQSAAELGHMDVIMFLDRNGFDIRPFGKAMMHEAVLGDDLALCRYLYERGVSAQGFWLAQTCGVYLRLLEQFGQQPGTYLSSSCPQRLLNAMGHKKEGFVDSATRVASAVAWVIAHLDGPEEDAPKLFKALLSEQIRSFEALIERQPKVKPIQVIDQLIEDTKKLSEFSDVVKRVAQELVLPSWREVVSFADVSELETKAQAIATEALIAKRDLRELIALSKKMHDASSKLPPELRPYFSARSWPALLTEEVDLGGGYTIVALGSEEELVSEGESLDHCVGDGGYAVECLRGTTQILSLRKDGERVATIELGSCYVDGDFASSYNKHWSREQFKGFNNAPPSREARQAYQRFVEKALANKIAFNPKVESFTGAVSGLYQFLSPFEQSTGIPDDEPDLSELIAAHYKEIARQMGEKSIFRQPLDLLGEQE
jgi:hypothetical protein